MLPGATDAVGPDAGRPDFKKRGPKLGYTFAYEDGKTTNVAWMNAAGRNGIPCSFVVDKAGKVAYIGHPMHLDVVLPKVVDGTWTYESAGTELAQVEKEVDAMIRQAPRQGRGGRPRGDHGVREEEPRPRQDPVLRGPKLDLLVGAGRFEEAKKIARA